MALFAPHIITPDSALGGSVIEKSLRFNQSETNAPQLRRTGTTTSSSFSIAMWAKLARVADTYRCLFSIGQENDANAGWVIIMDAQNIAFQGGNGTFTDGTRIFRDCTSWFHFLISVNSNNFTVYINGSSIQTGTIRSLDTTTNGIRIGANYGNYYPWDGYLADVYLIDGQAKAPTDFGYTDNLTGLWRPKKYTGTFGTGGAHLEFKDSSSVSALGKDTSGNGNDFTPYSGAFSVSSGLGNDSFIDTPTNNFPTLNPLMKYRHHNSSSYATNANLQWVGASDNQAGCPASMTFPTTGKWYWEVRLITNNANFSFGIVPATWSQNQNPAAETGAIGYAAYGSKIVSGTETTSWAASFGNGDDIGAALDMDNKKITFYKNNSSVGTIDLVSGYENIEYLAWIKGDTNTTTISSGINFGGNGFVYTPPTGFRALNARNRATVGATSIIRPQKHFKCITYTGNGSSDRDITGLEFKPDFVWIKNRQQPDWHMLQDSVRGANKVLYSNRQEGEDTDNTNGHVNYFNKDGFNVTAGDSGNVNQNSETYVAWCWKAGGAAVSNTEGSITSSVSANTEAGFSIVSYTGNGSNSSTVGHGLGGTPEMVVVKRRDSSSNWVVETPHTHNGYGMYWNFNDGSHLGGADTITKSSTLLTFANSSDSNRKVNFNGETYIAYCWRSIAGFSKFGKYEGNGSTDGVFIYTGFRPAWITVKNTSASNNWQTWDTAREPDNVAQRILEFNDASTADDASQYTAIDICSNGFKHRTSFQRSNTDGGTYLYMAFAEQPGITSFGTHSNSK